MPAMHADSGAPESIAVEPGVETFFEVWQGDRFTGRRFDSQIMAQRYAGQLSGATVQVSAPQP